MLEAAVCIVRMSASFTETVSWLFSAAPQNICFHGQTKQNRMPAEMTLRWYVYDGWRDANVVIYQEQLTLDSHNGLQSPRFWFSFHSN